MKIFVLALLVAGVLAVCAEKARFDNYRVYSVSIENEEHLEILREMEIQPDGIAFLESPTGVDQTVDLTVPPHKFADISELFDAYKIPNWIKSRNLQESVNRINQTNAFYLHGFVFYLVD